MDIKDIVRIFKKHQLKYGLNGDSKQEELFKWKLLSKQVGHPNTDAEDFNQEIRSLELNKLCYGPQITAIRNFAKYEPEDYRLALRELFDKNIDLQQRIEAFITTCKKLWDSKIKKKFVIDTNAMCDERLISCFLTFRNPQKYTFYKKDVYESLCNILGIEKQGTRKKLVHFYKLLEQYVIPVVENDKELMDAINADISKGGLIQSTPLIAQTVLWHYVCETQNNSQPNEKEIKENTYNPPIAHMKEVDILKQKKQIVLQGAPGTGKTYSTAAIAVAICDGESSVPTDRNKLMNRYRQLKEEKRIAFTTFHQSMDYEEFVEGIKPETEDGNVTYQVRSGVFRDICNEALKAQRSNAYDNFEDVWNKLVSYLEDNDFIDVLLLNGTKTFRVELNEFGTGLANRTYPNDTYSKGDWIEHKSKFFNKEQLYNIYRGLPGTPTGGHDNYRKAIIKHLKKEFGLVEYKEVQNQNVNAQNYVLIIDEINRANISKVLGELITLLEADKRLGEPNEISVQLPYSKDKFGVPANLYIIGTMNTADRSVGYIDYAIRRRFAFITIKADRRVVENQNSSAVNMALEYFDKVKEWMSDDNIIGNIDADDLMVGHSYFLANNAYELKTKMKYEVIPLLREYINDGILNADIKSEIKSWEAELE